MPITTKRDKERNGHMRGGGVGQRTKTSKINECLLLALVGWVDRAARVLLL